ncbi:MAG TPA: hypothetical protein VFT95_09760 [Micromonosporaceae bacterium]|nr:hypothetical protein [Micromonosporaceae bacterium]
MSTDVDASPERQPPPTRSWGSRYVWLAAGLVVVLIALFGLFRLGAFGDGAAEAPADYPTQLNARLVGLLEAMPAEGHGHGHDAAEDAKGAAPVCGVRVFGTEPADADALDEVDKVYAYHFCAMAQPGMDFLYSYKLTGPIAVTLSADPPKIEVAEGGQDYQKRVRELIPAPYADQAYNASLTPEAMKEVIRRYGEAAKK